MSYTSAIARVEDLQRRLGVASVAPATQNRFNEVYRTARSRFEQGPPRIDTSAAPTAAAGRAGAQAAGRAGRVTAGGKVPAELEPVFQKFAAKYNVPVALAKAVARAESGFRVDAGSPAGARGIMQLMPATARGLGVTNILDPVQNIEGGIKYLRGQLDRFNGDVRLALAAYNAGPGAVQRHGGIPPYPETQKYVQKVIGYAREYGLTSTRLR